MFLTFQFILLKMQTIVGACRREDLNGEVCAVISNNSNSQALGKTRIEGVSEYHLTNKTYAEDELNETICKVLTECGEDIVVFVGHMKKPETKV